MYVTKLVGPNTTTGRFVTAGSGDTNYCETYKVVDEGFTVNVEIPDSYTNRSFAIGDKVHALAYTGTFREVTPISGTLNTRSELSDSSDPTFAEYCGAGPFTINSSSQDACTIAGFTNLVIPSNAEMIGFLKGMAQTSALADLQRSFVNVPLIVAERRETIGLLVSKARQLTEIIKRTQRKDLKRYLSSNVRDRKRLSKTIANEHLALLFGVLPLTSEIEGLAKKLAAGESHRLTGRGRRAWRDTDTSTSIVGPEEAVGLGSAYAVCARIDRKAAYRISSRTSLSVNITSQAMQELRDWGFNPLATAYDLVPLSFLLEFISNLGTFIRAHDPLMGVEFLTGSTTIWQEAIETVTVTGITKSHSTWNYHGKSVTTGGGAGSDRQLQVIREVHDEFPDASLHFANNLTIAKAITVGALAIQRYLKPARSLIKIKPFRYKGPRPKYLPPINYR